MKLLDVLKKLIQNLHDSDVIEPCEDGDFNSPSLVVNKKLDGKSDQYHLVVNYWVLNKIIQNIVFPIPRIQDIFNLYKGCEVFSSFDIMHLFYTIKLDPES